MKIKGDNSGFKINSSHQSFNDKQKNVFDQLSALENNIHKPATQQQPINIQRSNRTFLIEQREETKYLRGRESIFKRPEQPISRCLPVGRVPDFRKNPSKWTKYSLEDVKDEDMSERSNTAAALSFLKELENRKETLTDFKSEPPPEKIIFKKSSLIKEEVNEKKEIQSSSFKNSKVVMPEYIVGQKVKKEKKNKEKRNASSLKQLKLDHLSQYDDGEEEC